MNDELRIKEEIINGKNDIILAEVATSNAYRDAVNQIRRNVDLNRFKIQDLEKIVFNEVRLPELSSYDIKADMLVRGTVQARSLSFQQLS